MLLSLLARNWSLILFRGIAAIVFGVIAFAWPGITLISLAILYGIYAAMDGGMAIAAAIRGGTIAPRWWLVLVGVISFGAAVAAMTWPGLTVLLLAMFIGAWAVARGIFEIIGAIQIRKEIQGEWVLILHGVISVLFGLFLLVAPGEGAIAVLWVIAFYAILAGVLLVILSLRLRKHLPGSSSGDAAPVE